MPAIVLKFRVTPRKSLGDLLMTMFLTIVGENY